MRKFFVSRLYFTLSLGLFSTITWSAAAVLPALPKEDEIKILILLKDKGPGSPSNTLTPLQWEDFPVYAPYVDKLLESGLKSPLTLKWQNAVSGIIAPEAAGRIRALPFISQVRLFPRNTPPDPLPKISLPENGQELNLELLHQLEIDAVHLQLAEKGRLPGEGMVIAVIDDGFYLGHNVYSRILASGSIKDSWDFVDSDSTAIFPDVRRSSHGAQVLSLIGGYLEGEYTGIAYDADFLLYRAEDPYMESYSEEDNVALAIERASGHGAQVINISLGYRYDFTNEPEHPFEYFDGKTGPATIAAAAAARRNILVVISMGNEEPYHRGEPNISSPADADSILAVGAVRNDGSVCSFSSRGHTADGRIKPDISAPGCTVPVSNPSTLEGFLWGSGTSFASPIAAGICALVWQTTPDAQAQEVREAILLSGSMAAAPDTITGHGVINAMQAVRNLEAGPGGKFAGAEYFFAQRGRSYILEMYPLAPQYRKDFYNAMGRKVFQLKAEGLFPTDTLYWQPGQNFTQQLLFIINR